MKTGVHPQYFDNAQVICACGNMFKVGSSKDIIKVEVCHKCHPYFTGEMKFVDTMGRVERFQKKQKDSIESLKIIAEKKKKKTETKSEYHPKSLREMLLGE